MRKKFLPALIALSCLAIAGLLVFQTQPRDPIHQGRKLTEWLTCLDSTNPPVRRQQGVAAVRQIGTNALPLLVKMLQSDDSSMLGKLIELRRFQTMIDFTPTTVYRWRAIYGFRALGTEARSAIPELAVLLNEEPTSLCAMFALMAIGPEAEPVLERALSNTNEWVRFHAAWGLDRMRNRV